MSAISPSSASLSAVQSLVSTSIGIVLPGSPVRVVDFLTAWSVSRLRGSPHFFPKPARGGPARSGGGGRRKAGSAQEDPQLSAQPGAGLDAEFVGQTEGLGAHREQDRSVTRMLDQQRLEPGDGVVAHGVEGQADPERLGAVEADLGDLEIHAHQFGRVVPKVDAALDADDGVVVEEVTALLHGAGKDPDLDGRLEVLEGEGG